jgi:hypothetical protein
VRIRFTKNTPTHHTFEIIREDGSWESASLETRSFMPHDLIHYAYESLAGCKESFYGLLARGTSLSHFANMGMKQAGAHMNTEMMMTERITGPLTSYLRGEMTNSDFLAALHQLLDANGQCLPDHMNDTFLDALKDRYRQLIGQWSALPHHVAMELKW